MVDSDSVSLRADMAVKNGLCSLRSIVGDDFSVVPKGFQKNQLGECVFRDKHMNTVVHKLEESMKDSNSPGVYIQGPQGAGKSILVYMITQYAKFHKNWLTVYIPDCASWSANCDNEISAQGFFIDRVAEALTNTSVHGLCPDLVALVTRIDKATRWEDAVSTKVDRELVATTFRSVRNFLFNCQKVKVLLIFDEVNALWSDKHNYFTKVPWNLTSFRSPKLKNGTMLVSGTTDAEFVGEIPSGVSQSALHQVGALENTEVETMMETSLCKPLKRVREFDITCHAAIISASGNIPRELGDFAKRLDPLSQQLPTADEEVEPPKLKKMKLDIDENIAKERSSKLFAHRTALDSVLVKDQKQGITVFTDRLFNWCKGHFLEGEGTGGASQILRVPNFIISSDLSKMCPTNPIASAVYFEWFIGECRKQNFQEENACVHLAMLTSEAATGGERGNSFERLLAANILLSGANSFLLIYRLLHQEASLTHGLSIKVHDRAFASANSPPKSCFDFAEGTLLSHVDSNGGEARFDLVFYSRSRVIFIEATVSDYRSTKLPPADDSETNREEKILHVLNKWMGSEFVVEVNRSEQHPTLCARYKTKYTSRSNVKRPEPPAVDYVILTTCPNTIRPQQHRVDDLAWIKVCFLEDLITSGLIPRDKKDGILYTQAETAGRNRPFFHKFW